ncbi:chromosome segregation SMC family protein [Sphingomonas oligophenolica]|uniref:Chromosome partition protein Smc n=1 Tax=Sphingomonas oligophenolica TaxID=301154 RepID=A0A502CRL7_9SPHN|nr:AAA family ATPase [Sphingomonas oligophenolica]TPG15473.1 chromosome segregation protein [Sphingomonas oligophenolica]
MRIKRLRIAGFKSFVDPADLRIEPGLTGVVGPNGCGKSNLLEALRWTMGEASAKSLRGAEMEDVIFAGTATRPPRDFAEVSILAELPTADGVEETEIVRRIERGAGSAYRIDGRDVRARDVALLFADAATGAHSPALVSQGKIGAVIAAKPADRRAMLEEAAGIAGLHVRRRDAEQKLRATEANLARLDEIIADQDARAAALKRQARAAERYRLASAQIRVAEARMIFARWRDAVAAADAARAEAAVADEWVRATTDASAAAAAYQHEAAETVAAARAAALAARDRASEAAHRLATLRTERATAERRIADLADAARRMTDDRAREGSLARDAADALTRLDREIGTLDADIRAAANDAPRLETAVADAERMGRDAEVALAQALGRQASEAAEARVATAALAAAEARCARVARGAATIDGALAELGDPAPIEAERDAAAAVRAGALAAGDTARGAIEHADADERTATATRAAADAALATARANLAAIDAEAAALTRATQRSGTDKLLDRVAVEAGYERALAAALGDDLDTSPDAWEGARPGGDDPAPPPGTAPLVDQVTAPAALDRRLAQIFIADRDTGQALAVGQRLVTREGALRRWDGYVATGSGAAAAERLARLNRLAAIVGERPAAAAALAAAEMARAAVEERITTARTTAARAREELRAADTRSREAALAEDRATTRLERLADRRADLAARRAQVAHEDHEAAHERASARAAVAALPDTAASAAAVATLGHAAEQRRAAVAEAREARGAAARRLQADRERRAAAQADTRTWRARAGEAAQRITAMDAREAEIASEHDAVAARPAMLEAEIAALSAEHNAMSASAATLATAERDAEAALRSTEATQRAAIEALAEAREGRAGAAARLESQELRRVEMGRLSGERFECPVPVLPEKLGFDAMSVRCPADESATHEKLSVDRERIGPVNLVAETELAELEAASIGNATERDELGQAVNRLRGSIGTLNREGRQRLLTAFEAVNGHFQRLFATLFNGGQAHLALIDSDDPLEAGLEIMAQPPGKRLQSLTLLSGGEQALTAVALIFGLFLTNPAPICILDEVDAPLDDANIERFCDLLDRMTRETETRYLIVTHNAVTMSRMHRLFGVTMIEQGVSRLVSVDLQAATTLLAAE